MTTNDGNQTSPANQISLLAHLAYKFSGQTETIATEALGYILSRSTAARNALRDTIRIGGVDVGPIARVETEVVGEKMERVDLSIYNDAGEERVLIEAKFWAGLTENQPSAYLERLPNDDKTSVLLFVAPKRRLRTLWPHIRGRAEDGGFTLDGGSEIDELRTAAVAESNRFLMLTSWRAMLDAMALRASVDGDSSAERGILELNALCKRQDAEAFLPIREGEFGPDFTRRISDLWELIKDVPESASRKGFVSVSGLNARLGFGRNLRLGSVQKGVWAYAWFGVEHRFEGNPEYHPLVLNFYEDEGGMPLAEIKKRLGYLRIPIDLLRGEEYAAVLGDVVDQMKWLADRISGEVDDDKWRSKWPGNAPPRR